MKKELILLGLLFIILIIYFVNRKKQETFIYENKAIIPINLYPELEILENLDTRCAISSHSDFKIKNIQDKFYLYKLIQNSNDEALKKLIPDFECSNSYDVINSFILKFYFNIYFQLKIYV